MKRILSLGALMLVLPLALTACNQSAQSPETPTSQKVVRIATESNFKPFSYLDNQGNIVGQMLKTDSDSVMLQSRTQAIVQISHKRADFDKHPLSKSLVNGNATAFDGNQWAKVIKEELDIKKDAKELRQSYDVVSSDAAAAMQDK